MELSKITIGKKVTGVTSRNQDKPRKGTVTAINQTAKGAFIEVTQADGSKFQTRAALIS